VGGVYAEETLLRAAVEKTKPCAALTDSEITAIHDALQNLLSNVVESRIEPCVVLDEEGAFIDVVPFKLRRYEAFKTKTYSSFNEALDDFYLKYIAGEAAIGAAIQIGKIAKEADRLKRVIAEQEQTIREAEEKAERGKYVGDAVYAHSSEFQSLLDKFSAAKIKGREWSVVVSEVLAAKNLGETPAGLFESFDARNLAINVCISDLHFGLSLRKTIFENAAEFFEQGKKAKQKAAGAQAALEESHRKLAEIEHDIREAEELKQGKPAEAMEKLAKRRVESKKWYEKFRWFTSSDGFLVVAGKDAVSNEVLIKKFTRQDDVIFHADITGAPFVVVKTEGKTPSEQALREAGEFAAAFSRAWREGMGSVDVYWVKLDQLSKTGPSGESVPHGAFAVVGKRNWMRGVPLKLAIGVVEDDEGSFVGGPIDVVKARAKVYVTIVPGDVMGKEILRRVLYALAVKLPKEQREKIVKTSVERIREFVPYTKGRLTEAS
jgi:predicted ribosome quality control (RQC) complex YloA/Tae2 family protein